MVGNMTEMEGGHDIFLAGWEKSSAIDKASPVDSQQQRLIHFSF
jgi:hypothetical protein